MENKENKIIADKINSLEQLPEGYQPNLEAKWALIQSEENNRGMIFFHVRKNLRLIAAVFLLLLLSTVLWVSKFNTTPVEISNVQPLPTHSDVNKREPKIIKDAEPAAVLVKETHKIALHQSPSEKKNENVNPEINPVAENKIIPEEVVKVTDEVLSPEESPVAQAKTKKSDHRYVQMDFDDEIKSDNDKNTYAQGFQLRLLINKRNPAYQRSEGNSSITLKRNF